MTMILRLEGIHTYYGLVHMLQGVSLSIAAPEQGRSAASSRDFPGSPT